MKVKIRLTNDKGDIWEWWTAIGEKVQLNLENYPFRGDKTKKGVIEIMEIQQDPLTNPPHLSK